MAELVVAGGWSTEIVGQREIVVERLREALSDIEEGRMEPVDCILIFAELDDLLVKRHASAYEAIGMMEHAKVMLLAGQEE
jgi:hypothetical protein